FFFSSRRRHTRFSRDWSSDVCSSDLVSMRTRRPLVRELLWNDQVIDTARVDAVLAERGQRGELDRLLSRASFGLALSFLLSAVQIGRASCRERGEVAGGAGPVQKKA